jgi:rhodanese-related sulfurtransferase
MLRLSFVLITFLTVNASSLFGAEKSVLRKEYPSVPVIEVDDYVRQFDSSITVDVRSKFEFDVIHINKAAFIPAGTAGFLGELEKLRAKTDNKMLVLYCNGFKCRKSFDSAKQALGSGFVNVKVLDAGPLGVLEKDPGKVVLLGKNPADKKDFIGEEEYVSKQVSWDDFKKDESDANSVYIDVRDPSQRSKPVAIKGIRQIQLDKMLPLLEAGQFKDKKLYFVDAVGKQNEWLQFYLKKYNYTNYKFLKGGVDALK